jgi:predicted nucleic acid-binding Zn ribbon protein
MPVYQYKVVDSKIEDEIIEIEQEIGANELRVHPITGETIKKIISATSLTLSHSSTKEKATLEKGNLEKNGFTVFKKDNSNPLKYNRTAGNQGPEEINLN